MENTQSDTAYPALPAEYLQELGLSPGQENLARIEEMAGQIKNGHPAIFEENALKIGQRSSVYSDSLLGFSRDEALPDTSRKIGQILSEAKKINYMPEKGLFGRLKKLFGAGQSALAERFDSTKTQLEKVLQELEKTDQHFDAQNDIMEGLYQDVERDIRELGLMIAACKMKLPQIEGDFQSAVVQAGDDPVKIMAANRIRDESISLERFAANLLVSQQNLIQNLPAIRIIQANNKAMQEKYRVITSVTIPAWKRQFVLNHSLQQQAQTVALADKIDDLTNQMIRDSADMLQENSVKTAEALNRSVIAPETLEYAHNQMLQTLQQVMDINRQGIQDRVETERKILQWRREAAQNKERKS